MCNFFVILLCTFDKTVRWNVVYNFGKAYVRLNQCTCVTLLTADGLVTALSVNMNICSFLISLSFWFLILKFFFCYLSLKSHWQLHECPHLLLFLFYGQSKENIQPGFC